MSEYTVVNRVTEAADWQNSSWTINLCDTSYVQRNTQISIDDALIVTFEYKGMTFTKPGQFTDQNGLLTVYTETQGETTTAQGQTVPPGTPLTITLTMVILDDGQGDIDRHVTGLTLVDDPEDAGVMGGDDIGG